MQMETARSLDAVLFSCNSVNSNHGKCSIKHEIYVTIMDKLRFTWVNNGTFYTIRVQVSGVRIGVQDFFKVIFFIAYRLHKKS